MPTLATQPATTPAGKDKTTPATSAVKTPGSETTKAVTANTTDTDMTKDAKDNDWQAIAAGDGIFDSRREAITALIAPTETKVSSQAKASDVAKAERKVEVRAHDAAGNTTTLTLPWPKP